VNNIFENNYFNANYQGLIADSSNNNQFLNNTFESKGWYGLILSRCTDNIIKNNTFNKNGLELWGNDKADYIQTIEDNVVNGKPLIYFYRKTNTVVPNDAGQIILVDCHNVRIQRTKISHTTTAILIVFSTGIKVSYNEISENNRGIYLYYAISCTVTRNNFIDNSIDASFVSLGFFNSIRNIWRGNYWDSWLGTRSLLFSLTNKWIIGRIHQRRVIDFMGDLQIGLLTRNVDRRPARRPYSL
jgi:parallel beta-helix repeat protein